MKPGLCKNCGRQNGIGARFCSACGNLLSTPSFATGYHTVYDAYRLEELQRELYALMETWQESICGICVRLEEIASLCEGEVGQHALQLAEQLKQMNLLLQDTEQLLHSLKAVLAVFQEMDNIAPDVFSSGGSVFAGSGGGMSIFESFSMTESYSESKSPDKPGAGSGGASSKAERASAPRDEYLPETESGTEKEQVFSQLPGPEDDDIFAESVFSSDAAPVQQPDERFAVNNARSRMEADTEASPWHCKICGKQNNPDTVYCRTCGSSIHSARTVPPPKPRPEEIRPLPAARRFALPSFFGRRSSKKQREESRFDVSSVSPADEKCRVDQVYFSALTDERVQRNAYYTLRLFMGMEEHRQVIEKIKQTADKQLREDKTDIAVDVRKNQQVKVCVTSPVAVIDDNEMTLPWTGDIRDFSFMYFVPPDVQGQNLPISAHIYVDDVIATRLQIRVPLEEEGGQVVVRRQDVMEAFMSYSSEDRERVLAIVQGMHHARPDMKIFLDVEMLRSGEDWKRMLQRKIDESQVLYLCWSTAAKKSAWVDFEWRHAYNTKGAEVIEPVPLESPQLCAPPRELDMKHFNDVYMQLALAEKTVRAMKGST